MNINSFTRAYCQNLQTLLAALSTDELQKIIDIFLQARSECRTIYFMGNGGSAATASHFCEDLAEVGRKTGKKLFNTSSLAANTPYITALGNDYGFEYIFSRQIEGCLRSGDVLVAISASGNSPNLINAIKLGNERGARTIGLLGFDGGILASLCAERIIIRTEKGAYGPVEDVHLVIDHLLTSALREILQAE